MTTDVDSRIHAGLCPLCQAELKKTEKGRMIACTECDCRILAEVYMELGGKPFVDPIPYWPGYTPAEFMTIMAGKDTPEFWDQVKARMAAATRKHYEKLRDEACAEAKRRYLQWPDDLESFDYYSGMFMVFAKWNPDNKAFERMIEPAPARPYLDARDPEPQLRFKTVYPNWRPYWMKSFGDVPGIATLTFLFAIETCPRLRQGIEEGVIHGEPTFHFGTC